MCTTHHTADWDKRLCFRQQQVPGLLKIHKCRDVGPVFQRRVYRWRSNHVTRHVVIADGKIIIAPGGLALGIATLRITIGSLRCLRSFVAQDVCSDPGRIQGYPSTIVPHNLYKEKTTGCGPWVGGPGCQVYVAGWAASPPLQLLLLFELTTNFVHFLMIIQEINTITILLKFLSLMRASGTLTCEDVRVVWLLLWSVTL